MWNRQTVAMFLFLSALLLVFASSAAAQDGRGVGARAGVSGDPGQAYVGGHIDLKEFTEKLWFRPNVEVGTGDGRVLVLLNGEFVYFWKGRLREWTPYAGGGPALVVQAFRAGQGDSGVGPGFNFVVGIQQRRGLLVEMKIGAMDSPGFKVGIGWTWE
jgi:hypothetical protein